MIRVFAILLLLPLLPNAVWGQEDADTQNPFWQNEYCINPSVPYSARLNPREGSASLLFDITADGKPNNIRVVSVTAADGDKKLADDFGRDAKKSLKRWEYFAYIKDDQEAPRFDVPITFKFVDKTDDLGRAAGHERCLSSTLPEPPSHAGDPRDPLVNLAQCQIPNIPLAADKQKISGKVALVYNIKKNGQLADIRLADAQEDNPFAREAMRAIKQWRYKPYLDAGKKTARPDVTVEFAFGDIDESNQISCTQAPFGTSRTISVTPNASLCKITYNNGVPVPSKGCYDEIE